MFWNDFLFEGDPSFILKTEMFPLTRLWSIFSLSSEKAKTPFNFARLFIMLIVASSTCHRLWKATYGFWNHAKVEMGQRDVVGPFWSLYMIVAEFGVAFLLSKICHLDILTKFN